MISNPFRSEVRKFGVFFEFAALSSGFGMLVGGFFAMNLKIGIEEVPHLGWIGMLLTTILMAVIMACFMRVLLFSVVHSH